MRGVAAMGAVGARTHGVVRNRGPRPPVGKLAERPVRASGGGLRRPMLSGRHAAVGYRGIQRGPGVHSGAPRPDCRHVKSCGGDPPGRHVPPDTRPTGADRPTGGTSRRVPRAGAPPRRRSVRG